jgi:hypothetical protein
MLRTCTACKYSFEDFYFVKLDENQKNVGYFKLCDKCRDKSRKANNLKKDRKSKLSKVYYNKYKKEIKQKNKKWREANKEKLKEYENSPQRKEFHKQWLKDKKKEDPCRFIFYSAKQRSKAANVVFNITKQDVLDVYPRDNKCPMLGLTLKINTEKTKENSPSLDRIVPEKGYVKNNIIIISHKANRIKNNASLEDLERIVEYLKLELKTINLLEKLNNTRQGTL